MVTRFGLKILDVTSTSQFKFSFKFKMTSTKFKMTEFQEDLLLP